MSTQIDWSSCPSTATYKYDVFLSFRGKDSRNSFVSHLYFALKQKGILTFKDDVKTWERKTYFRSIRSNRRIEVCYCHYLKKNMHLRDGVWRNLQRLLNARKRWEWLFCQFSTKWIHLIYGYKGTLLEPLLNTNSVLRRI